jgi:hypothetical protein
VFDSNAKGILMPMQLPNLGRFDVGKELEKGGK